MSTTTANTFKVGDKVRLNKITKGESLGVWNFLKPWENPRKIFNIVSVEGDVTRRREGAHGSVCVFPEKNGVGPFKRGLVVKLKF